MVPLATAVTRSVSWQGRIAPAVTSMSSLVTIREPASSGARIVEIRAQSAVAVTSTSSQVAPDR